MRLIGLIMGVLVLTVTLFGCTVESTPTDKPVRKSAGAQKAEPPYYSRESSAVECSRNVCEITLRVTDNDVDMPTPRELINICLGSKLVAPPTAYQTSKGSTTTDPDKMYVVCESAG